MVPRPTAADDQFAVRAEYHTGDIICMSYERDSTERENHSASFGIPYSYHPAPAADDQFAIWAECDTVDVTFVSLECESLQPGFNIPYLYGMVVAAADDRLPVWAKCHTGNTAAAFFSFDRKSSV